MSLTSASFVIPMYNEEKNIAETVEKLESMAKEIARDYEIIISDDASTDGSASLVESISRENRRVKLVRLTENEKFGGALREGIKKAGKDVIIYTDSDLPVDIHDIKGAVSLLDAADIVTAYSTVKKGENLRRIIMSKVYNFLVQFFFKAKIKDINSGFKIFKRKIFHGMEFISKSPFIDVEIFIRAMRKGFVIKQYPVIFKHRKGGKSYISRPEVVCQTFIDMMKFRFSG